MKPQSTRGTPLAAIALLATLVACDGGTAPPAPPPALSAVDATAATHEEVLLTWPTPARAVGEFRIERATGDGAFAHVATVPGGALSYRDTGLEPATNYRYRVRACDPAGCSPFTAASATTLDRLEIITPSPLPSGIRGVAYNGGLNATGGAGGYLWTVLSGSLPAGLALSEQGILSGMPETEQTSTFIVRVQSEDGQTASREFILRINSTTGPQEVSVETPRLPPALAGAPFGVALTASGGDGSAYSWSVVGGSLPPGLQLGTGGRFSGSPSSSGTYAFSVRVTSGGLSAQKSFSVVVVANDTGRFNITPFEVATVPAEIRPHLDAAIARWERVITGNLGPVTIPQNFFSSPFCGGFGGLVNGTSVEDLIVMMDISPIDGPGKILGQAGPCGLRSSTPLPFVGVLTLDSEDLAPMAGTQTLTDVIFHEIGHILGFGTLWGGQELLTGGGTADPRFTGTRAMQEYSALGGTGSVPAENTGGSGTKDSHWRESIFRTEILTGFSERIGVAMPLSRLTIASMADLGYTVDFREADAYALPGAPGAPPLAPLEPLGYDVVLDGPVRVLPEAPPPG